MTQTATITIAAHYSTSADMNIGIVILWPVVGVYRIQPVAVCRCVIGKTEVFIVFFQICVQSGLRFLPLVNRR